jgi:hypothetical protein
MRIYQYTKHVDTRRVTLITNPVISHERGKEREVPTAPRVLCIDKFSFILSFCA